MAKFFGLFKSELIYLQKEPMDHFKQELMGHLEYYNNGYITVKRKGLPPALYR